MPKASCKYEGRGGEYVTCKLINDICGHVKYCQAEHRWKLSESAVNCTLPNKFKEAKK